jgi:hypothetical protein
MGMIEESSSLRHIHARLLEAMDNYWPRVIYRYRGWILVWGNDWVLDI